MIPKIEEIRAITVDNSEKIIQSHVDKYIKAIANGIQQEARCGRSYYEYLFLPERFSFKLEAMKRVEKAYMDAGYIVTRPQCGGDVVIRFSWEEVAR